MFISDRQVATVHLLRHSLRHSLCHCLRIIALSVCTLSGSSIMAQCPEEPPLLNFNGAGTVACPCFIVGEQFGAVFTAPPEHYPLQILRVGFGWGSQFGGAPQSLEGAINIYEGGLPAPGPLLYSLPGPVLSDGFINEFDLTMFPPDAIVDSGPFSVTMTLANNSGLFEAAPVHDGAGCIPGRNLVFASPGGWLDACGLGVSGNWLVQVVYRPLDCGPAPENFIRCDANNDGVFSGLLDGLFILNSGFIANSPQPACLEAADCNNDGSYGPLLDALYGLNAQFITGAPPPAAPYPDCGPDDDNALGCASPPIACL